MNQQKQIVVDELIRDIKGLICEGTNTYTAYMCVKASHIRSVGNKIDLEVWDAVSDHLLQPNLYCGNTPPNEDGDSFAVYINVSL